MEVSSLLIEKSMPIVNVIKVLDQTAKKLLIIVEKEELLGSVTDGDIRRWILKGGNLSLPVYHIMNKNPLSLKKEEAHLAFEFMRQNKIEGVPLVDENNKVINVLFWNDRSNQQSFCERVNETPIVIMAGGKGSRLYPYTKIIPKPLIPIGDIPIVERIMKKFSNYGYHRFFLTICYKKEMIKAYFSEQTMYSPYFIEEDKPLGTAGALRLLDIPKDKSFFVSNCDVIVDINYLDLMSFHKENNNKITIVTAMKSFEIPYGVVELGQHGSVKEIEEKPCYELLVNTGCYVLNEEVRKYIPKNQYFDMTDFIQLLRQNNERIGAYPIMGSNWLDMGEFREMKNMMERLI